MNPVVHFEMPYANRERMATFYESAFGWQTQMLGQEMGNYVLATTTETDEDFTNAYDCLHRRNFFGQWMPGGATWLYGFAGEYPWATSFNTEPEEWHGRKGVGDDLCQDVTRVSSSCA
jgi:hypothetical protein